MIFTRFRFSLLRDTILMLLVTVASNAQEHTFIAKDKSFLLDGKPYQIISGEMHYPRVPRAYWHDRLMKAKLLGLNTITTYAFWNLHEPQEGKWDFSGQNDISAYIREAQSVGLHVILRPGPFICAEWELGGYPSWLLKDRALKLRSRDPRYAEAVSIWFEHLASEIEPLLLKNGGPIIAVQVENEYGAFGDDQEYLEGVLGQLRGAGLGDTAVFTSNQANELVKGSLPGVPSVVNFGTGGAQSAMSRLEAFRPDGVRMTGEYWAGWFDKWGEEHHQTDGRQEAAELRDMLKRGYSVSLYMFHGGTTFGWMNGADSHTGADYHPDTTSYDYDAPLDESGSPTYKYTLFQQAIAQATGETYESVPPPTRKAIYRTGRAVKSASLWRNLPDPVKSKAPLTFEQLGQNYGYVLYRVGLDVGDGGTLTVKGLHSFASVYVNQEPVGTLDRRLGQEVITIPTVKEASTLDILVENTGRVNYSHSIRTEQAGITGEVTLGTKALEHWEEFSLPMDHLERLRFQVEPCTGPCFLRTTLLTSTQRDTYFDTRGLHKGQIWVGDHNLGRFWSIGPQFSLFLPGVWLSQGETQITLFDIATDPSDRISTVAVPVTGRVTHTRDAQ